MKDYAIDNIKGRIKLYATKVEKLEIASFERKVGFSQGTISRTGQGLSLVNLARLCEACPELSLNWVISGKGDMLMKGGNISVNNKGQAGQVAGNVYNMGEVKNITVETLCEENRLLQQTLKQVQAEKKMMEDSIRSLDETNKSLHKENIKLLDIVDRAIPTKD